MMKYEKIERTVIPCRVIVGVLGCLGCTLLYMLRTNLSVAIIAMVDEKQVIDNSNHFNNIRDNNNQSLVVSDDLCYDIHTVDKSITNITSTTDKGRYQWTQSVQGVILGSYFYGYTLTHICGTFADRFGAKWMVGLGVFMPAILNAFIPTAADIHYTAVVVLRVLMGAFHGLVFSGLFSLYAKWFPQSEMNLPLTGIIFSGNLGGVLTMPLVGYLCKVAALDGWPTAFYFTSFIHVFWFLLWIHLVSDRPEDSDRITGAELDYIMADNKTSKNVRNRSTPWRSIFVSRAVWASIVSKICGSFGYYVLCTKMPTYLDTVFGMSIQTNSWFNSLFYAILCVSTLIAGPLSTWVNGKHWISLTRSRKNFQSFGMFGCCICIGVIPLVGCNIVAVMCLLLSGIFLFGSIAGGEYACIPEYAPNYSGTVYGVASTLASTTGFMGPQIVGLLLDHGDGSSVRHKWDIVWYLSAAIYGFGGAYFEIYGTTEPQTWALIGEESLTKELNKDNNNKDNKDINLNV